MPAWRHSGLDWIIIELAIKKAALDAAFLNNEVFIFL